MTIQDWAAVVSAIAAGVLTAVAIMDLRMRAPRLPPRIKEADFSLPSIASLMPKLSPASRAQAIRVLRTITSRHDGGVGANIRKWRETRALSQDQLAERMGVARTVISQFENGSREPNFRMVVAFGKALNVSVSTLSKDHPGYR